MHRIVKTTEKRLKCTLNQDTKLIISEELPDILLDIANYEAPDLVQNSLLLLDHICGAENYIFQRALDSCLLLSDQSKRLYDMIKNEVLPNLPNYFGISMQDEYFVSELSPIQLLTEKCWLKEEVVGYEPHKINQGIINSFGMVEQSFESW